MLEVKYFLEDHWWKLLIGIGVVVLLVVVFGGDSEEEQIEETNETGMITDDNYGTKAEDAYLSTEYEKELEEESAEGGSGGVEESGEEEIRVENITYDEETPFELVGDLIPLKEKYKGKAFKEMIDKFEPTDKLEPEGDILRNKNMLVEYGSNYEGCINNKTGYNDCVTDILSELKWLSGDMGGELEKSYNMLGEYLANQNIALKGMKESHTGGQYLNKVLEAYELSLFIRGSVVKDLGLLEGMETDERLEIETKVKTSLNELAELDKFLENFWLQVMVTDTKDEG